MELQKTKEGCVELYLKEDGASLHEAVIHATPNEYGVLLTLNAEDTAALYRVLEHIFDSEDEAPMSTLSRQLWDRSSFFHLAPLSDRRDLFWFCHGPLNTYAPTEHMRVVFQDLKLALSRAGINATSMQREGE